MVLTNDEELYWNAKRFADRGKPFGSEATSNLFLGLNYRMTELEAAIGRVQLKKLPGFIRTRRRLAALIREGIADLEAVSMPPEPAWGENVYWFLRVRVDVEKLTVDKKTFVEALKAEGLPAGEHYTHATGRRPWFMERRSYGKSGCPWSCPLYGGDPEREFALPEAHRSLEEHFIVYFHEGYSEREAGDIVAALKKVEGAYLA